MNVLNLNFKQWTAKGIKAFGVVDVSVLAKYLLGNKEEFQQDHEINNVKQKIEKAFYDFLTDKGFIKRFSTASTES